MNAACLTEQYTLPNMEDILASLRGGSLFTTLDLREAHGQLLLDGEAKKLFCYDRLVFGVLSSRDLSAAHGNCPGWPSGYAGVLGRRIDRGKSRW